MTNLLIRVDYVRLEKISTQFNDEYLAASRLSERLVAAVARLRRGGWEGENADAFYRLVEAEDLPAVQRLVSALKEAAEVILQIKNILEQAENEAANQLQFDILPLTPASVENVISRTLPASDANLFQQNLQHNKLTAVSNGNEASAERYAGDFSLVRRAKKFFDPSIQQIEGDEPTDEPSPDYAAFMNAQPGETVTLSNGISVTIPHDPEFHNNRDFYYHLLTQPWAYNGSLTPYLDSDERVQTITDGRPGPDNVNLDYYSVTIQLPDAAAAEALFQDIADSPNNIGGADSTDSAAFILRPDENEAIEVGDVFDLDMAAFGFEIIGRFTGVQNGAIVVADTAENYAIFQTIYTPSYGEGPAEQNHGYHPVNGARAFGYTDNGDGVYTFWTMGADTPTNDVAGNIIFFGRSQQEENWRNWQDHLRRYARTEGYDVIERREWRNYSEGWGIFSHNQVEQDPS